MPAGTPHHHIDLGTVLRGTVCALYSNLVTRPTGAAVRAEIERAIADAAEQHAAERGALGPVVSVIDFTEVTLLDYSCADEIVAKLMLRRVREVLGGEGAAAGGGAAADGVDAYFVFRGVGDGHLDAVEAVLERHALAIVAEVEGELRLVGDVEAEERRAWHLLHHVAPAGPERLAEALGGEVAPAAAVLARLAGRRLVMPAAGGGWLPVGLPARD